MADERILIRLAADDTRLKEQLDAINRRLDEFGRNAESAVGKLSDEIKGFVGGAAIVGVVKGLTAAAKSFDSVIATLQVASGSVLQAGRDFEFVQKTSNEFGVSLQFALTQFGRLEAAAQNTGLTIDELRRVFETTSRGLAAVGADSNQTEKAFLAITQIISKGSLTLEELSGQLGDSVPGAVNIAARAFARGNLAELLDKVGKRAISSQEFIRGWSDEMERTFGNSRLDTVAASLNRLDNAFVQIRATLADRLNVPEITASFADLAQSIANSLPRAFDASRLAALEFRETVNRVIFESGQAVLSVEKTLPGLFAEVAPGIAQGLLKDQEPLQQFLSSLRADTKVTVQEIELLKRVLANDFVDKTDASNANDKFVKKPANVGSDGVDGKNTRTSAALNDALQILRAESENRLAIVSAEQEKLGALRDLELARVGDDARAKFAIEQRYLENIAQLQRAALEEQIALAAAEAGQKTDTGDLAEARSKLAKAEIDLATAREVSNTKLLALRASEQKRQEEEFKAALDANTLREDQQIIDQTKEKTDKAKDSARQLGLTFTSAFEDAIVSGRQFSDVLQSLGQDLLRLFVRRTVTEPLINSISSGFSFSGLLSSIGFRADGGPVSGGRPYIVGERGPELFIPPVSGAIVPNGRFGGANIQIIDQRGKGAPIETETQSGPGGEFIRILVRDEIKAAVNSGSLDKTFQGAFGVSRQGVAR